MDKRLERRIREAFIGCENWPKIPLLVREVTGKLNPACFHQEPVRVKSHFDGYYKKTVRLYLRDPQSRQEGEWRLDFGLVGYARDVVSVVPLFGSRSIVVADWSLDMNLCSFERLLQDKGVVLYLTLLIPKFAPRAVLLVKSDAVMPLYRPLTGLQRWLVSKQLSGSYRR